MADEGELVAALQAGDDDARDVAQEAFPSAFRAIGRFEGTARLSTWLHRITVNAAPLRLRRQR
jgi:RNA polymerase sigma-70 factor (ECF subfamily)